MHPGEGFLEGESLNNVWSRQIPFWIIPQHPHAKVLRPAAARFALRTLAGENRLRLNADRTLLSRVRLNVGGLLGVMDFSGLMGQILNILFLKIEIHKIL